MIEVSGGLAAVTSALASGLEEIPGLRVFDHVPDTVVPPAALIQFPETLRNPQDVRGNWGEEITRWAYRIPISLILGRVSERDLRERYDQYVQEVLRVLPRVQLCHLHVLEIRRPRQISYGGIDVMQADVLVEVWAA